MDQKRLLTMNIVASILSSYYANKVSFCMVNKREPNTAEKENLLKRVISMFENLSTSYLEDIENIAEGAR
jgi:hypothetical protein